MDSDTSTEPDANIPQLKRGGPVPPLDAAAGLGSSATEPSRTPSPDAIPERLKVSVRNVDLKFTGCPLMVGHYRSTTLTGAEAVVDWLLGGQMSRALTAGIYPAAPGTNQVFLGQGELCGSGSEPLPAVIVVGLGDEGELRATDLVYTVRQAILEYAKLRAEVDVTNPKSEFAVASTLIGSGGSGVTAGCAAQSVVQGAHEANAKLRKAGGWPILCQLTLVELYLERASDAWNALRMQEQSAEKMLELIGMIQVGPGALRRSIDASYRGTSYDFIRASLQPGIGHAHPCIAYSLDTKRARAEVHAHRAQTTLLRELIAKASNSANNDPALGRTLFNLLIPVEMEPFLGGSTELVMEVDEAMAGIPWELLDTDQGSSDPVTRPWAIRSKLIRKLQVEEFRSAAPRAADAPEGILIVGNPKCPSSALYPSLEGAKREALAVAWQLNEAGIDKRQITCLPDQDDAVTILVALLQTSYRIVHVAGHGELGPNGGVVLSGQDTFLGANEINAMRSVPELVFLNCCHLAGQEPSSVLGVDRARFAANIAEALIRIGVRCVVAAGWAVHDKPAELFAKQFYASLTNGERFMDAVSTARYAAWFSHPDSNTWAAYQCYGDPDWRWKAKQPADAKHVPNHADAFGGIASAASLAVALETLAVQSEFGGKPSSLLLAKLQYLESQFGTHWGGIGAIAEAFGYAYSKTNDFSKSIEWYKRAVCAEDGSASLRAVQALAGRLAVEAGPAASADSGNAEQEPFFKVLAMLREQCKWKAGDAE